MSSGWSAGNLSQGACSFYSPQPPAFSRDKDAPLAGPSSAGLQEKGEARVVPVPAIAQIPSAQTSQGTAWWDGVFGLTSGTGIPSTFRERKVENAGLQNSHPWQGNARHCRVGKDEVGLSRDRKTEQREVSCLCSQQRAGSLAPMGVGRPHFNVVGHQRLDVHYSWTSPAVPHFSSVRPHSIWENTDCMSYLLKVKSSRTDRQALFKSEQKVPCGRNPILAGEKDFLHAHTFVEKGIHTPQLDSSKPCGAQRCELHDG